LKYCSGLFTLRELKCLSFWSVVTVTVKNRDIILCDRDRTKKWYRGHPPIFRTKSNIQETVKNPVSDTGFLFSLHAFHYIMLLMARIILPLTRVLLLLSIAWFNSIEMTEYLYWKYLWLDIPMHFFGGLWVALTALWIAYYVKPINTFFTFEKRTIIYLALAVVLTVGMIWELFEIRYGAILAFEDNFRIDDMLSDLMMDTAGAFVASYIILVTGRRDIDNSLNIKK